MSSKLVLLSLCFLSFSAFAADPLDVISEIEVQHSVDCSAINDTPAFCLNKSCWYKKTYQCTGAELFQVELKIHSKELADGVMEYRVRSVNFLR